MKKTYVLLAIALIGGSVAIAIIGNKMGLTKDSWPGWVQAIGSIAALGVAIFVMSRQNRHAAQLVADADKRALLRRTQAAAAILDSTENKVRTSCQFIVASLADGNTQFIRDTISTAKFVVLDAQGAARAIPAHELGSYKMVSGLNKLIDVLTAIDKGFENWLAQTQLPHASEINSFLTQTIAQCEKAKTIFIQGVDTLKAE
ncbi:hypothetical protein FHI69_03060 [Janthinobacterium lividum]|uniref:Uncharacterized protein n=1 Tax=Janthinobacterium lividum TaxID=29581 RepID=A0A5C4P059_9BURK|nr:hypothetical protein [Janthinobacterium lividum]TNC78287.1 hypothetical protein FHI69_03060 [Janthinobacterium lividum]